MYEWYVLPSEQLEEESRAEDTCSKRLNMPDSAQDTYPTFLNYHHDAKTVIANESMKKAAQKVKEEYVALGLDSNEGIQATMVL